MKPPDYNAAFAQFTPEARERFEKTLAEIVRQGREQLEKFTESQMVEAMKQALLSGDFKTLVVANTPTGTHTQAVVYIPFAREQELESEIRRLTDLLDKAGIEWRKSKLEYECTL